VNWPLSRTNPTAKKPDSGSKKKFALLESVFVATLVGSLITNGGQFIRNRQLDKQAALDALRLEELQTKKEDLVNELNTRATEIKQKIEDLRIQQKINKLNGGRDPEADPTFMEAQITRLEDEKDFLQKEIDQLVSSYK